VNALREIKFYQKHIGMCIPRSKFSRIIKELVHKECYRQSSPDFRMTVEALTALQEAAEAACVTVMEMSNRAAIHAKRVTLMPKDVRFIRDLIEI
jgi:histone H3/H4